MDNLYFPGNVSYSTLDLFKQCERRFLYTKILREPASNVTDMKYADFGKCLHKCLESPEYVEYEGACVVDADLTTYKYFSEFKLFDTDLKNTDMVKQVQYGFNLPFYNHITKKEQEYQFKIHNLNFKAIIDFELSDGSIGDWKTSTYSPDKLEEYKQQLLFYSWIKWKATGEIPPKCIIVFTKAEKVFEFSYTKSNIIEFEKDLIKTLTMVNQRKVFGDYMTDFSKCHFCNHKSKCAADSRAKDKYINITIKINHDHFEIVKSFKDQVFEQVVGDFFSYEVDNAHFVKKAMLAKGVKNYDGIVRMYKGNKLPLGFLSKFRELCKDYSEYAGKVIIIREEDNRMFNINKFETVDKLIGVELRDYQIEAVEHMLNKKIVISEVATGAGKTTIAAEIIRRLGMMTLFVVDRNILLEQTKKAFESMLGIKCGTITEGKQTWVNGVNIGSIQTISKLIKKKDAMFLNMLSGCNVVFVDEAHGAKSKSYQELMKNVTAKYRIALTGTAYADGNSSLELYKSFGFPDYKISAKQLIDSNYLVKPEITFLDYDEGFITNGSYDEVYSQILKCEDRLSALESIVTMHNKDDNNVLVMCDRIEHIDLVAKSFEYAWVITGKTTKEQRVKILDCFKTNRSCLLIATSSIIQKGVDIPELDCIINYSANLGTIKTIQSLGRVLRKSEGKDTCYYYDFNDTHRVLKPHTKARKEALIAQGYEIE